MQRKTTTMWRNQVLASWGLLPVPADVRRASWLWSLRVTNHQGHRPGPGQPVGFSLSFSRQTRKDQEVHTDRRQREDIRVQCGAQSIWSRMRRKIHHYHTLIPFFIFPETHGRLTRDIWGLLDTNVIMSISQSCHRVLKELRTEDFESAHMRSLQVSLPLSFKSQIVPEAKVH